MISETEPSRHKCLIYDGEPSEQLPVVIPFLVDSLESNWRTLYLGSPDMVGMVDGALSEEGVDVAYKVRLGSLILSSDRSHLVDGGFEPRKMVDNLSALVDTAVVDGFEGLCATGDMKWELGDENNFDHLLEYEARLEQLFREKSLRGICQYHRGLVPARAVRDALVTHRCAYVGENLNRDNLFYLPPELLLETPDESTRSKQGEWMCQQIVRVLEAERKRDAALTALADVNRDLERRVKARTEELEAANRQLEAFSYSVSHDLRAPLRAIVGFSQILAEGHGGALGEEGRGYLDRVRLSAREMGELIEGMLTLSRVERADLNRVPVDLSGLAEEVAGELREGEPDRSAEFVIAPGLRVAGDRVLIRAMLVNLLSNAWKFTSRCKSARIEVGRMRDESGGTAFFIRDNGTGFDMNRAGNLFGPFQRLHRQDEFPGTGIGLATVQRIIHKHGGRIWANAAVDEGATFYFTLGKLTETPAAEPAHQGGNA